MRFSKKGIAKEASCIGYCNLHTALGYIKSLEMLKYNNMPAILLTGNPLQ